MVIALTNPAESSRNLRRERQLWHNGRNNTQSLGCTSCPDLSVCGGLKVETNLFNCLGFCCHEPDNCEAVCRNNPEQFVRRVREIDGFDLNNVPRALVLTAPKLPNLVPVLFHGMGRRGEFRASSAVCLSLYKVISRSNGQSRYRSALDISQAFGISPTVPVILTGTAFDAPLERWWSLGPQRRDVIRELKNLRIALVTTPNFSLFVDQPRWDDLHSMKRIALVHEEFLSEGLVSALHVNARTERDWERWRDYLFQRPEVTHVAFEFATGAGWDTRINWHADQLMNLARTVERPLHIIIRGGVKVLSRMADAFSNVTLLETSTFLKTVKRQRATLTCNGALKWCPSPMDAAESLDHLLTKNWEAVAASFANVFDHPGVPSGAAG